MRERKLVPHQRQKHMVVEDEHTQSYDSALTAAVAIIWHSLIIPNTQ